MQRTSSLSDFGEISNDCGSGTSSSLSSSSCISLSSSGSSGLANSCYNKRQNGLQSLTMANGYQSHKVLFLDARTYGRVPSLILDTAEGD